MFLHNFSERTLDTLITWQKEDEVNFDKIVTSNLPDGKRSRNIKMRAQLKILTERDIG